MHGRIFQISTSQIEKDNYLNENTLMQGDGCYYDYCSEIDDEVRKKDIACLVNHILPKGMFQLISEDTIRYNGGIEQWKEFFVANVRKKAEALNVENMLQWTTIHDIEEAIENPLDTYCHFYLDWDGCRSYAEKSFAFMEFVCGLEVGTTLYIGGVIDYHF